MNNFESRLYRAKPIFYAQYRHIKVRYMREKHLGGFFGYALDGVIYIKHNLPMSSQKFILLHEWYHLHDNYKWLGWFGSELRANCYGATRCPLGFLSVFKRSLNKKRLTTYKKLLKVRGERDQFNRSNET